MPRPRVSVPITLTVALVAITLALTVGWEILVVREFGAFRGGFSAIHWVLLILGSLFFTTIITVAILQGVWLVREIRSNQRQQNFIDAVTHELHTPLTSLRLYLDTLRSKELDERRRDEFLAIMTDDLERLQRTINQILNAARSEVRRVDRAPIDLNALLEECASEAREHHALDAKQVHSDIPGRARVRGDLEQLRVVFRNLIENAIRYAGENVQVDLRVHPLTPRKLEIEVIDQGMGIPESALGRVFLRFQRISQEAVRSSLGLGLGLYIVRNIVRAHGGAIRAESEGEGRGSRFIVTLPGQIDGYAHPDR
jgi:signal transduction histidine kinase